MRSQRSKSRMHRSKRDFHPSANEFGDGSGAPTASPVSRPLADDDSDGDDQHTIGSGVSSQHSALHTLRKIMDKCVAPPVVDGLR